MVSLLALAPGPALAQKIDIEFDDSTDFRHCKTFPIVEGQLNTKAAALNSELTPFLPFDTRHQV
jgi:hypothetical protein